MTAPPGEPPPPAALSWGRVQEAFHEAADREGEAREAYLRALAREDPRLREEVERLLVADARAAGILDDGVASLANRILSASDPSGSVGARFGPYRIVSFLGEGGMGTVYRVVRDDLESEAALKLLRDATLSPARRARFLAEQRTLAHLRHPGIARLLDAGTLPDGTPWFVMELVDGVPLDAYLARETPSLEVRLRLFREIGEAVQHAHAHAVIHRDLKPSNVLVTTHGEVRLIDFGIAKQLEGASAASHPGPLRDPPHRPVSRPPLTRAGFTPLTPSHAAPEQLAGASVGVHTDVYALGVLLFELLAGAPPPEPEGLSPLEAARHRREHPVPRPSSALRGGPEGRGVQGVTRSQWADLDVLCGVAMHPDPGRRYPSVEALLRDLDHFENGRPLEARPDSSLYRAGKFARRNRVPLAVAGASFALMVALTVAYGLSLMEARDEALAEAARAERIQTFTLNLFRGTDPDFAPAEELRVLDLVRQGVPEARALGSDPELQAGVLLALGEIHHQIGALEEAAPLLEEALALRIGLRGEEHREVAEARLALALLREAQAELDEAEALARQALEGIRRALPPGHPQQARVALGMAHILESRGRYEEAQSLVEEAVRVREGAAPGSPDLAAALGSLSNLHFYQGDFAAAEAASRRALELNREAYGPAHPAAAADLINLGAIHFERGEPREAEALFREALAIQETWYGRGHPAVIANRIMLGRALVRQEAMEEATEILTHAASLARTSLGSHHPRVASAVNELGLIAQGRADWPTASAHFEEVVEIYTSLYPEGHAWVGVAYSNLAGTLQAGGDPAGAEAGFRAALAVYARVVAEDHPLVGIARIRLGGALLAQGRGEEAEAALREGKGILEARGANPEWVERADAQLTQLAGTSEG